MNCFILESPDLVNHFIIEFIEGDAQHLLTQYRAGEPSTTLLFAGTDYKSKSHTIPLTEFKSNLGDKIFKNHENRLLGTIDECCTRLYVAKHIKIEFDKSVELERSRSSQSAPVTYVNDRLSSELSSYLLQIDKEWRTFYREMVTFSINFNRRRPSYPKENDFKKTFFGFATKSTDEQALKSAKINWWQNLEKVASKRCSILKTIPDRIELICPNGCNRNIQFNLTLTGSAESLRKSYFENGAGNSKLIDLSGKCNFCGIFKVNLNDFQELNLSIVANHSLPEVQQSIEQCYIKSLASPQFINDTELAVEMSRYL